MIALNITTSFAKFLSLTHDPFFNVYQKTINSMMVILIGEMYTILRNATAALVATTKVIVSLKSLDFFMIYRKSE